MATATPLSSPRSAWFRRQCSAMAAVYGLRDKQAKQAGGGIFARDEAKSFYHTGGGDAAQRDPIPMGFFNREPPPRIVPRLANYSKFVLIAFYLSRAWLKDNCINNELMYESFEVYSLTLLRPIGLPLKAGDERMT